MIWVQQSNPQWTNFAFVLSELQAKSIRHDAFLPTSPGVCCQISKLFYIFVFALVGPTRYETFVKGVHFAQVGTVVVFGKEFFPGICLQIAAKVI